MREIRVDARHERTAIAELDDPRVPSETLIIVKVCTSGAEEVRHINIEVRDVLNEDDKSLWLDLRPVDFRSLLATLESAIVEAELSGILPRDPEGLRDRGYSVAVGICAICQIPNFEHLETCTRYLPDLTTANKESP